MLEFLILAGLLMFALGQAAALTVLSVRRDRRIVMTRKATNLAECPNCGRPFDGHYHRGDPCDVCEAKTDGMADPGRAKRNIRRRQEAGVVELHPRSCKV